MVASIKSILYRQGVRRVGASLVFLDGNKTVVWPNVFAKRGVFEYDGKAKILRYRSTEFVFPPPRGMESPSSPPPGETENVPHDPSSEAPDIATAPRKKTGEDAWTLTKKIAFNPLPLVLSDGVPRAPWYKWPLLVFLFVILPGILMVPAMEKGTELMSMAMRPHISASPFGGGGPTRVAPRSPVGPIIVRPTDKNWMK